MMVVKENLHIEYAKKGGDDTYMDETDMECVDRGSIDDDDDAANRIGEHESKAVRRSRTILILVLFVVAAFVCITVYSFSRTSEYSDFKKQFTVHAEKVIDSIATTTARTLTAIEGFALQITIHAIDHHQTWPNVVLTDFETRAKFTIDLAEAISLVFLPIVTNKTRKGWEKFSVKNQGWLRDGLSKQRIIVEDQEDEVENINKLAETYGYSKYFVPDQIFRLNGNKTSEENSPGPFTPLWQFAPAFPISTLVNYNTLSNPTQYNEIIALMETEETIVGKAFDYDKNSDSGTSTRAAVLNLFLNHGQKGSFTYSGGPVSDLYTPIFDGFGDDKKMVGIITSSIYWQVYFQDVLPYHVNGVIAVLENDCGQSFTYRLDGAEATFLGEGDLHDPKYDDLEVSTGYGGVFLQKEDDLRVGQCIVNIRIFPSKDMMNDFLTPIPLLFAIVLASTFMFTSLVFIWHQRHVEHRQMVVMKEAVKTAQVVESLFPANVRDRLFEENENNRNQVDKRASNKINWGRRSEDTGTNNKANIEKKFTPVVTSENIFGSKPIADLFMNTTIMFADMVGFTAWASVREPTQVFTLLETIYHSFDVIAKKMRVFKVETVGDCYVAVAGLPKPREDHAIVMCKFASYCLERMSQLCWDLGKSLGPDTGELGLRIGLHSGPVTAGVLRGDKGRFQLFGDTMNTASRMESTGMKGRIHVSLETAELVKSVGKSDWIEPRKVRVVAKGKGELQTFWLRLNNDDESTPSMCSDFTAESSLTDTRTSINTATRGQSSHIQIDKHQTTSEEDAKIERYILYNVEVLARLLKQIIARRDASSCANATMASLLQIETKSSETVLDEVKDIISLPKFDAATFRMQKDPSTIELPTQVNNQLKALVTKIALMHINNPFHNFEHASHVTMSVTKLLSRIVNPIEVSTTKGSIDQVGADLHDHTFGITSDPLTQFACAFAALIHDLDHPGVTNATLVELGEPKAAWYKNKSVAEQNSVDLSWDMLMDEEFNELRSCIYCNMDELKRFRQLVVNVVMATDIMDKDLNALRKARWEKAFREGACDTIQEDVNRKATIVIEHIIQASDVSHTMQHWHVYRKWNERLFNEVYKAFKEGRTKKDPTESWYKGEIGFFDFYIIPLAKKLETCGVFGVSSDEYLNYALANRREWEERGEQVVREYIEKLDKN